MIHPLSQIKSRLRMRYLRLLFILAEEGSLRKTAERMSMTQPAATKALHELEETLGTPLFTRTSHGLETTVFGEAAIRYARLVLTDLENLHAEMSALEGGHLGTVRLGAMSALTGDYLPHAIAKIKSRHPKLNVFINIATSDVLLHALKQDQLDFMIARIPQGEAHADFAFEVFGVEQIRLVTRVDHPAQQNPAPTLLELSRYP